MKKSNEDETDDNSTVIKIVGQYNKKGFNKNQLIKNLSLVENVSEIIEE